MNKFLTFAAIAIMAIACTQEQKVDPKVTLDASAASLTIPTEGGDATIVFESNVAWTAALKEAADWCTITPTSGEAGQASIKLVATENKTNDNRVAVVVIKTGAVETEATVTQLQKDALVLNGEKAFEVPFEGGEVKISVSHNIDFDVTTDEWIVKTDSKAMETSELVFAVAENRGAERVGTITIKSSVATETITVTQATFVPKLNVIFDESARHIKCEGGSISVTIDANIEYDVIVEKNDWLKVSNEGSVYTFSADAYQSMQGRDVSVDVVPKDKELAEFAVPFFVIQDGRVEVLWDKNPSTLEGIDVATNSRLAKYGDNIILANTNRAYILNPKDGSVVSTFDIPGINANSVCVDDAGHIILANDAPYGETMSIYYLPDPAKPEPQLITEWSTLNYYGFNAGNLRVKGDITKEAVISAIVSAGAGGALIMWQITDGKCGDWKWTSVPYEVSNVSYGCAVPLGTKISDGFLYAGYGGDYNIKFTHSPALGATSNWTTSYVTGYTWMENINCLATCEYKGKKYAAFTAGCHWDYDDAEAILLDITDPAKAELVYTCSATYDVERGDPWVNLQFTYGGAFSDILLYSSENELTMVYIDTNFGSMSCITIK